MRTTVNLPDDVYEMARERAHRKRISLGEAITELVREAQAERKPVGIRYEKGIPVFDLPPGGPKITPEMVKELDEEW